MDADPARHLDVRLPDPPPQSNQHAEDSGRRQDPAPGELAVQLASLHRATEVARSYWLKEHRDHALPTDQEAGSSSLPSTRTPIGEPSYDASVAAGHPAGAPAEGSSEDTDLELAGWDRLIHDLDMRIKMVTLIAEHRGEPENHAQLTSSNLRLHFPHPFWARRYPGPAGEWFLRELASRSLLLDWAHGQSPPSPRPQLPRNDSSLSDLNQLLGIPIGSTSVEPSPTRSSFQEPPLGLAAGAEGIIQLPRRSGPLHDIVHTMPAETIQAHMPAVLPVTTSITLRALLDEERLARHRRMLPPSATTPNPLRRMSTDETTLPTSLQYSPWLEASPNFMTRSPVEDMAPLGMEGSGMSDDMPMFPSLPVMAHHAASSVRASSGRSRGARDATPHGHNVGPSGVSSTPASRATSPSASARSARPHFGTLRDRIRRQICLSSHWHGSDAERAYEQFMEQQLRPPQRAAHHPEAWRSPLAEWIDFQAISRGIGQLSCGSSEDTRVLARLAPVPTMRSTADDTQYPLQFGIWSTRGTVFDVSGSQLNERSNRAVRQRANVLRDDHACWRTRGNEVLTLQYRGMRIDEDKGEPTVLPHCASDADSAVAQAIHAWELMLPDPAKWLPIRSYLGPTQGVDASNDTVMLQRLVRHEVFVRRRLAHTTFTEQQRSEIDACSDAVHRKDARAGEAPSQMPAEHDLAVRKLVSDVDALIEQRTETYTEQLRSLAADPRLDDAQIFTLTQLYIRMPPWADPKALHGLVFLSYEPIQHEHLHYYDDLTDLDVYNFAQRWHLQGPGLSPPVLHCSSRAVLSSEPAGHAPKRQRPPLLPVAYFALGIATRDDPSQYTLDFSQTYRPGNAPRPYFRRSGISGRYLAIKLLRPAEGTSQMWPEVQFIGARGFSGPRNSAQGGWCDMPAFLPRTTR